MNLSTQQQFDLDDILVSASNDLPTLLDIMDRVEKFIDICNKANKEEIGGKYGKNKP